MQRCAVDINVGQFSGSSLCGLTPSSRRARSPRGNVSGGLMVCARGCMCLFSACCLGACVSVYIGVCACLSLLCVCVFGQVTAGADAYAPFCCPSVPLSWHVCVIWVFMCDVVGVGFHLVPWMSPFVHALCGMVWSVLCFACVLQHCAVWFCAAAAAAALTKWLHLL